MRELAQKQAPLARASGRGAGGEGRPQDQSADADDFVIAHTRAWIERAVIGLNLCPFARAPSARGLIRYAVSSATEPDALLADFVEEMHRLARSSPDEVETTLLVHPHALLDFDDFNDFLSTVEAELARRGYAGILQVASFHPRYRFAGTQPGDIGNATNHAPYPTLHLLREDSIDAALARFPAAGTIYEANIATMERLGPAGWSRLREQCRADAQVAYDKAGTAASAASNSG